MMVTSPPFLLAFFLGIVPPLLWLIFWLREDRQRPEPRGRIVITFIAGALAVVAAYFGESALREPLAATPFLLIVAWAGIEEVVKWFAAYITALRNREIADEPIDIMIYLITAALGFAAAENVLFLIDPLASGAILEAFATGSMRFVGATVLHTLTSGILGGVIALAFYAKKISYRFATTWGLILVTGLHGAFNLLIINSNGSVFGTFIIVWIAVIGLILLFERVKQVRKTY